MHPLVINLAVFVLFSMIFIVRIIFPGLALHEMNNKIAVLKTRIESIIQARRIRPELIDAEILRLRINGITVNSINHNLDEDFDVINVDFNLRSFFLQRTQNNQRLGFLLERV